MGSSTCAADLRLTAHPGLGHNRGGPDPRPDPPRQSHSWGGGGIVSGAWAGTLPHPLISYLYVYRTRHVVFVSHLTTLSVPQI